MSRLQNARIERQADSAEPHAWTQAWVAERIGVAVRSVKAWEAGASEPRPFYQKRLSRLFGLTWDELWP